LEEFFWTDRKKTKIAKWKSDYVDHSPGYCCLKVAPDDLVILGAWVLNEYDRMDSAMGLWIRDSVANRRHKISACRFGAYSREIDYGYQWWVPSPDSETGPPGPDGFTAIGRGGQFLHVFPEQDVVVVQLSAWSHTRRWYQFWRWFERSESNRTCESLLVHRLIADQVAATR